MVPTDEDGAFGMYILFENQLSLIFERIRKAMLTFTVLKCSHGTYGSDPRCRTPGRLMKEAVKNSWHLTMLHGSQESGVTVLSVHFAYFLLVRTLIFNNHVSILVSYRIKDYVNFLKKIQIDEQETGFK